MVRSLYTDAGGSFGFLVAATGIDPDAYMAVLDEEIEQGIFDKYKPHQTSFTLSNKNSNNNGRPTIDNPTNENTIISKTNNSNGMPKPSTK